jgi:hypothetical protein
MSSKALTFKVKDKLLGEDVTLDNISLPLLLEFTEQVMAFLRGSKRVELKEVKTAVKTGSLELVVDNETGVLDDAALDYDVALQNRDVSTIDPVRADIFECWQREARKYPDRSYEIAGLDESLKLKKLIISGDTDFVLAPQVWVGVEKYVYGRIFNMGGKSKANVHLQLSNGNSLKIDSDARMLAEDGANRLYHEQLVRIKAEENVETRELRNEKLLSFESYEPTFDEGDFEELVAASTKAWRDVTDPSAWVEELRGNA